MATHVEVSDVKFLRAVTDTVRFFAPTWRRTYWTPQVTPEVTRRIPATQVQAPVDTQEELWNS